MQNVKLKALVSFKVSLPMIWGIETRTTEPSDGYLHLRETSLDTIWEPEHFRLFFTFLAAGLVDLGREYVNFPNASDTEKQM